VRFLGITQEDAETLFTTAHTAAYLMDLGEFVLLADQPSAGLLTGQTAIATLVGSGSADLKVSEELGTRSIGEFLTDLSNRFPGLELGAWGRYLIKVPSEVRRTPPAPATQPEPGATMQGIVLSEGFEGDPWVRWQRYPDATSQYTWGVTTCAAHSGSRSADAVRDGTVGSSLSCTDGYPLNQDSWMDDSQCENIQGASEAWLDLYVYLDCQGSSDSFGVFYAGGDQHLYGYAYSGNIGSWLHYAFNLRHWYKLGDLTTSSCNKLSLLFESDAAGIQGIGVRVDDITVQTGPLTGLSCSSSASVASGPAPLTVNFTGTVNGASGVQTYTWSFGDGTSATTQNASHTFTSAGEYDVGFRVVDGSNRCTSHLKVTVTSGGTPLAAGVSANVTSGVAPLTVQFTGTASGGTSPYTYSWSFGDGTPTSSTQNPAHTFTAVGSYTVILTVHDAASATATASTTITVTSQAAAYRYFVPAIAHNPGISNTMWRTNIGVVNRSGSSASLTVTFHSSTGDDTRSTSLPSGSAVEWANILESLFGVSPSASIQGSLEIGSNVPLSIVARNFNETSAGTYGQFFPALTQQQALTSGQVGVLPLLKKSANFRTNIGAINLGTSACTILLRLFDSNGNQVGTSTTLTLQPGRWQQANDIFVSSGAGSQDVAYATTEIQTSGGRAWLYAAVVDARTGDPTTVPVAPLTGPAASQWLSQLADVSADIGEPPLSEGSSADSPFANVPMGILGGGNDTGPEAAGANQYAGYWYGKTSQNLPINIHVTDAGLVDYFTIKLKLDVVSYTCTGTAAPDGSFSLNGNQLSTTVTFPGSTVTSDVAGTFSSKTAASGTYTGFSGSFVLICGSSFTFGFGTPLSSGTWSASPETAPTLSTTAAADQTSGTAPLTITFSQTPTGGTPPYSCVWIFGDGGSSSSCNATHNYGSGGNFTPKVYVTDGHNWVATSTVSISLVGGAPLTATAGASPTSGSAPLTVYFSGSASGGTMPFTYSWDFGDGTPTSSTQSPSHKYSSVGTYTATLTVHDNAGLTATSSKTISVTTPPPLSATISASPTSGVAPLTVNFSGSASGGTSPYTYSWDFGDGTPTSSEHYPSHTYATPGNYTATLTVHDAASATATATKAITVTAPAGLAAGVSANVTSGVAPLTVQFTGTASGGTSPYTYSWSFGDGTPTSSTQNPAHTFTAVGSYTVILTVHDAASATATASTTITVTSQAAAYRYFVPAIAHNPGISNTMWRTNIGVVNRSGSSASLTVTFHSSTGDDTRSTSLPSGSAVEWANILESLFGVSPSASIQGSLEIGSNVPLSIVARNFNETSAGTYGQFFPALTQQQALTSGQVGVLPLLKKSANFRTNIGAINLGTSACTILLRLFDSNGNQVGTSTTLTLQPGRWQQANDIFVSSGAGSQDVAYATTEIQTSGGRAWLYAAVVDARTGDPTTVPMIIQ
jgi:PKD repeat protein